MREFLHFLRFLSRNKITLILIPVITVVACYFLVRELPDQYRSQGRIATGLVDKTEQILADGNQDQEQEISRKFDNLIQLMRLKKTIDQVSYKLILHDLTARPDSVFTDLPQYVREMDAKAKNRMVALFIKKYKSGESLSLSNPEESRLNDLLRSMGYDNSSLLDKLTIHRLTNSDYINIEFEGNNPHLTAFVVNTLSTEFLTFYASRLKESNNRSVDFLEKFMLVKLEALNARMNELKNFKIQNRVLNLNEQARSLYGHIIDFETKREIAKKDVIALTAALRNIDSKFDPADRRYLESAMSTLNQNIATIKEQLQGANELYIRSNFDPAKKAKVDSLQNLLSVRINESTDKYIYSPLVAKENLITHKLQLEIDLELAKNSIQSIQSEVSRLNVKFDGMVPNEARIQEYETGIELAGKEYIDALQRYNNARLESNFPITLKIVERAVPGTVKPSKKMLLVVLSGIISFVFCLLVFFILYYLDSSIRTPVQLANATGIPVLGRLNRVSGGFDFAQLNNDGNTGKTVSLFRNLIRSVRYELDDETHGPKMVTITSLAKGAGKTLLTYSLAWAYARINQKVLIIDGNFNYPDISAVVKDRIFLEDFFQDVRGQNSLEPTDLITIMACRGGDVSLLEIAGEEQIQSKIRELKKLFNVILVESDSLSALNKTKEWITYSDRVVVVYEAGTTIREEDEPKIAYLRSRGAILSGWVLTKTENSSDVVSKTPKKSKK